MNFKINNCCRAVFMVLLLLTFANLANAQGGSTNLPAEGEISRGAGQFGVNRRVAIGQPEDALVRGYFAMTATFTTALQLPTGSALNNLPPGGLPNKPTFYFGLKGAGSHWLPDDLTFVRKIPGHWVSGSNLEMDAGLEYDSRPASRGWRAFISVNRVQMDYRTSAGPWRGQANQYFLKFFIDEKGVPHLNVVGGNDDFGFAWNHTGVLGKIETQTLIPNSYDVIGMKKVIANTRPDPRTGNAADNYRLDGTRFTCTTVGCKIYYIYQGALGVRQLDSYLSPRYPSDNKVASSFGIDGRNTGYDTPLAGLDSYDWPRNPVTPTRQSRRIVDFPNLDGATSTNIGGVVTPNIIDTGRVSGSENLTQGNVSRYQKETVRINLYTSHRAAGRLSFIRRGNP